MSHTLLPIEAAVDAAINAGILPAGPEFVDAKGLRSLFGYSWSHGYHLADMGLVKTVCLRKPGATRGKRLWRCQSVARVFASEHRPSFEMIRRPPGLSPMPADHARSSDKWPKEQRLLANGTTCENPETAAIADRFWTKVRTAKQGWKAPSTYLRTLTLGVDGRAGRTPRSGQEGG